jgi:NAD-dependent dihydropyrimidine dehydrogenase PreA subunit
VPLLRAVAAAFVAATLLTLPAWASAQAPPAEWLEPLRRVLPAAERFSDREGQPPVFRAYRTDPATAQEALVGYAFLTSDFQPEEMGFDGPVQVLVGMDPQGVLTGVFVVGYHESLRSSRGDFLAKPGYQEQFAGKRVTDAFQVKRDVDGITGATLTVGAMSRGIRNAARRVALALDVGSLAGAASGPLLDPVTIPSELLDRLSWTELIYRGVVQQIQVLDKGRIAATLSLLYLRDEAVAELVIGPRILADVHARAGARVSGRHLVVAGLDGPLGGGVNLARLSIVQDQETVRVGEDDVLLFGPPREGKMDGQVTFTRVLLVDSAVDVSRPFTFVLDLRPGLDVFETAYPGARMVANAAVGSEAAVGGGAAGVAGTATEGAAAASAAASTAIPSQPAIPDSNAAATESPPQPAAAPQSSQPSFDIVLEQDETLLARTLATTSWWRVGALIALLALASAAFASKRTRLRGVTLAATLVYLGFVDAGFLSVSHITSGIRVGPQVYLSDLPLLILVVFTVLTTLLWGRVFCGYLCPFGALQDLLERITPRRFKREIPRRAHERLLLTKYGALAVVLAPALGGFGIGVYQYFEPFGTVFFASRSVLLWSIAGSVLAASVVIPRFYCRYLCPLGAALAIGSLLAPFRIRRVEQCGVCQVCEQRCPTGAIVRERVDFKECVRCNVCETKLIQKAGVCRHDMVEVRSRLVALKRASGGVAG